MALLEEAARQLYREWFVRLRFPGREHTRIINGVPEGWQRKKLAAVAELNRESLANSFDGQIEYVDIAAITPGQINETTLYEFNEAPSRARRVVRHGDIIWSCVRPNRRSHAVIWQPASNLIVSTGFAVITPTSLPTSFLYQAITTDSFVGYLENHARGAAYPAVLVGDFERAEILVPPSRWSMLSTILQNRYWLRAITCGFKTRNSVPHVTCCCRG
jgi:type I restriction enzyme S subunit